MRQHLAVVKFEAEDRTSQSGRPYSSVAVAIEGRDQLARLFGPAGHEPFRALRRGQQIAVAEDSAGKLHLLEQTEVRPMGFAPTPAPQAAPVAQQQAPAPYQVQAAATEPAADQSPILAAASAWAAAYFHLIQLGVDPAAAPAAASTCLIQTFGRR